MIVRLLPVLFVSAALASSVQICGAQAQTRATAAPPSQAPTPKTAPAAAQPAPAATTAPAAAPAAAGNYTPFATPTPPQDVVATLTAAGKFTIFLKAVDSAGLTATLKQPAKWTVFVPTDDAFAALPAGALDDLLKPENRTKLQHILLYHIINTPVTTKETAGHAATDIASGAGPTLHMDGSSGALKINDANVVQADVTVSNGTVQVIDKVLMPAS